MSHTVAAAWVASHHFAGVRLRVDPGTLSKVVPEACGLVWKTVKAAQVQDAGRHVVVYRDSGEGLLDIEVGVETGTPFSGLNEVIAYQTPAGNVAFVTHYGPYHQLGDAHQAIRQWCAAQGHALTGTRWEIYGHWHDDWNNDPSRISTRVFYLLK